MFGKKPKPEKKPPAEQTRVHDALDRADQRLDEALKKLRQRLEQRQALPMVGGVK